MELDGGKELVTVRTESYVYIHTRIDTHTDTYIGPLLC